MARWDFDLDSLGEVYENNCLSSFYPPTFPFLSIFSLAPTESLNGFCSCTGWLPRFTLNPKLAARTLGDKLIRLYRLQDNWVIILGVKENLELMKTLDDAWNAGPNSHFGRLLRNATEKTSKYTGQPNLSRPLDATTTTSKPPSSSKHSTTN